MSPLMHLADLNWPGRLEYSIEYPKVTYWEEMTVVAEWLFSWDTPTPSGVYEGRCHVQLTGRVAHASGRGRYQEPLPGQDYLWNNQGHFIDGVQTGYALYPQVYIGQKPFLSGWHAYGPYFVRELGPFGQFPLFDAGSDSYPNRVDGVNRFPAGIPASVGGGVLQVGMRGQAREYTLGPLYLSQLVQHANDSRRVDVIGSTGKPGENRLIATLQFD
jgi:hypothetical protein